MRNRKTRAVVATCAIAVTLLPGAEMLTGCGGSGPSTKIDSVHLATIPADDKKSMFDAQNRIDVAKANLATSEKAEKDADAFFGLVKSELGVAKAKSDQAKAAKKVADGTGIVEKVREAEKEEEVANIGLDAFEAKLAYASENKSFSKDNIALAEAAVYEAEAAFELEKMKLMEANGISVAGIDGVKVRDEHSKYSDRLAKAKASADKSLAKANEKKALYDGLFARYEEARAALRPTSVEPGTPEYLPPSGPSEAPPIESSPDGSAEDGAGGSIR